MRAFLLTAVFAVIFGCASSQRADVPAPMTDISSPIEDASPAATNISDAGAKDFESEFGIKVLSLRLTATGYMLDFRYRVVNADKAVELLKRQNKPYIVDLATGARFPVPSPPKIGPLRPTSVKPLEGRDYFILFINPSRHIKSGAKVTIVIGDFRAENLTVQ